MTADIEPYSKTDTELPGLVLLLALLAVLSTLVLVFS